MRLETDFAVRFGTGTTFLTARSTKTDTILYLADLQKLVDKCVGGNIFPLDDNLLERVANQLLQINVSGNISCIFLKTLIRSKLIR